MRPGDHVVNVRMVAQAHYAKTITIAAGMHKRTPRRR